MTEPLSILILEDEPDHVLLIRMLLERDKLAITLLHVMTEADFLAALATFAPEIVLVDFRLPGYDGLSALAAIKERRIAVPVIMISGQMGEEFAVRALQAGAADYLLKPNLQRLPAAVRRAVKEHQQQQAYLLAQVELRRAHDELEARVKARTAELLLANSSLHQEIEDHRRTERELSGSRTLITAVFASLFGNVGVLDQRGEIIAVNDSWLRFGHENNGLLQRVGIGVNYLKICRAAQIAGEETATAILNGVEAVLAGTCPEFTTEYSCEDAGQSRRFRMLVAPLKRPEGGAIVTHIDITRHHEAEFQVQRLSHDMAHFGRVSMAGELAGALAHELRQPLTAILSNSEAGRDAIETPGALDIAELREILTDIATSAQHAGDVIGRLRSLLSKGQSELQSLAMNEIVGEILPLCRQQATLNSTTLVTDLAPDLPLVRGDRIQLEQVLMNLIGNGIEALKAAPRGDRRLVVRTSCPAPNLLEVAVSDNGPGIPEPLIDRIFDSFFSTKPQGMGMGLSICRSIAQSHGGRIWAENNPSQGAILRLQLPELSNAGPAPALPGSAATLRTAPEPQIPARK